MTSIFRPLLQGALAGGAAAYLQDHVQHEAGLKTNNTWTYVALQVNHLLLLTAETLRFATVSLGHFGLFVQTAYILTPFVLVTGLCKKQFLSFHAGCIEQWNAIYLVGVVVNSLATLVLGNPLFAIASLTMLAIDLTTEDEGKFLFAQVKKVAAVLALIGYGAQVFACRGIMAGLAKVSTVIVGVRLCAWDFLAPYFPKIPFALPGKKSPRKYWFFSRDCCPRSTCYAAPRTYYYQPYHYFPFYHPYAPQVAPSIPVPAQPKTLVPSIPIPKQPKNPTPPSTLESLCRPSVWG